MGLKSKKGFLRKYFRCLTLTEILPLYVNAISQTKGLYENLPKTLLSPTLEKLSELQEKLKKIEAIRFELDKEALVRKLANLTPLDFLKLYVELIEDDESAFDSLPSDLQSETIFWLEEIRKSVTGENGLFSKNIDLEKFIDGFIFNCGGFRLSEFVNLPKVNPPDNADYYFPNQNVIVELKILEKDILESKLNELEKLEQNWKNGRLILGLSIDDKSSFEVKRFKLLRKSLEPKSLQANKQIRQTKIILNKPDAFGIILYLNDGSYSLDPFYTIELISDPIRRHFKSINGFVYFTFRKKAVLPNEADSGHFIWQSQCPNCPDQLVSFMDNLGTLWFNYLEKLSGVRLDKRIRTYNDNSYLRQLKF